MEPPKGLGRSGPKLPPRAGSKPISSTGTAPEASATAPTAREADGAQPSTSQGAGAGPSTEPPPRAAASARAGPSLPPRGAKTPAPAQRSPQAPAATAAAAAPGAASSASLGPPAAAAATTPTPPTSNGGTGAGASRRGPGTPAAGLGAGLPPPRGGLLPLPSGPVLDPDEPEPLAEVSPRNAQYAHCDHDNMIREKALRRDLIEASIRRQWGDVPSSRSTQQGPFSRVPAPRAPRSSFPAASLVP
jgi:hypothetical protein